MKLMTQSRLWTTATVLAIGSAAFAQQGGQQSPEQSRPAQSQADQNQAGQDQGKNQAQQDQNARNQAEQKPEPQRLAVIKLQHSDPQQISQLLRSLDQPASYTAAYRGAAVVPQGQPGPQQQPLLIAADSRSKTLFVRGDQERLGRVEELIKSLDTEGEIQAAEFGDARIVPIKHANHGEVMSILQQLQLPASTFQLGDRGVVVLRGGEEDQISQAQEVISALDQESRQSDQNRQQNRNQRQGGQNQGGGQGPQPGQNTGGQNAGSQGAGGVGAGGEPR